MVQKGDLQSSIGMHLHQARAVDSLQKIELGSRSVVSADRLTNELFLGL